jgi:hypothetical protein
MSDDENKKHLTNNAKVKCVLCGKVGFLSYKKELARHLRLAHNKKYDDSLFVEVTEDVPVDIKPKDKMAFKKMYNKLKSEKKKIDNTLTSANQAKPKRKKPKRTKPKRKSIYWGAVIKTAFETKR